MIWLNAILDFITRLVTAWVTGQQQVEKGVSDAKSKRAEDDLVVVKERIEQKQKVDDEVSRLSPDDRRQRLRQWAKPKPPDNRSGG